MQFQNFFDNFSKKFTNFSKKVESFQKHFALSQNFRENELRVDPIFGFPGASYGLMGSESYFSGQIRSRNMAKIATSPFCGLALGSSAGHVLILFVSAKSAPKIRQKSAALFAG